MFTREELEQCADGNCTRCGRCCFLYRIPGIPLEVGNAYKPEGISYNTRWFREKAADVMCWQLRVEGGLSSCACHAQKNAPLLAGCRDFIGDSKTYEDVKQMTKRNLRRPESLTIVNTMCEWLRTGRLADVDNIVDSPKEAVAIFIQTVKISGRVPKELFDFMNMQVFLKQTTQEEVLQLSQFVKEIIDVQLQAECVAYLQTHLLNAA